MRGAGAFLGLALLGLGACDVALPGAAGPSPAPASVTPQVRPAQSVFEPSAESLALRRHYARVEQDLLVRGLLRRDGGGPDTPFNKRMLVENFVQIALFTEHGARGLERDVTPTSLGRWDGPVRIGLTFGASVPSATRSTQEAQTRRFAQRLARVTGHPISYDSQRANFHVVVLDEDERRASKPILRGFFPGLSDTNLRNIINMPRDVHCLVITFSPGTSFAHRGALAIIRSEHPPLSWTSCLHEEVAQGLGLLNDSRRARPSIFNDDEEFAFLTTHDELLLKMLYDPRMRIGMGPDAARATAEVIASELLAQGNI